MTVGEQRAGWGEARVVSSLTALVVVVASLRFLGAVLYGIDTATQSSQDFGFGPSHTGDVLTAFGGAGDGVGALLALVAVSLVIWSTRGRFRVADGLYIAVVATVGLTIVSALLTGIGYLVLFHRNLGNVWGQFSYVESQAVAYILLAAGALVVMRRFVDESAVGVADDGFDAVVFAVDRGNGNVRAFFSPTKAPSSLRRRATARCRSPRLPTGAGTSCSRT
jgi:hypothetical protein